MSDQNSDVRCVAIISPGDMGHAVGKTLVEDGLSVISCLDKRSERTRALSQAAGIVNVDSLRELTLQADLILSILVPDQALDAATEIAGAARVSGRCPYVADCNAVSPQTVLRVEEIISDVGGKLIDASIIGFPPRAGQVTRIYASGPHAHVMSTLHSSMLEVVQLGDAVGQASGIKMCYAALTKGSFALEYAMLIAAQRLDVLDDLCAELDFSQTDRYGLMREHLPRLPAKARRWIGEMNEIALTFDHLGVPRMFHEAAAEIYRLISASSLSQETPENIDFDRTLAETIKVLST